MQHVTLKTHLIGKRGGGEGSLFLLARWFCLTKRKVGCKMSRITVAHKRRNMEGGTLHGRKISCPWPESKFKSFVLQRTVQLKKRRRKKRTY